MKFICLFVLFILCFWAGMFFIIPLWNSGGRLLLRLWPKNQPETYRICPCFRKMFRARSHHDLVFHVFSLLLSWGSAIYWGWDHLFHLLMTCYLWIFYTTLWFDTLFIPWSRARNLWPGFDSGHDTGSEFGRKDPLSSFICTTLSQHRKALRRCITSRAIRFQIS